MNERSITQNPANDSPSRRTKLDLFIISLIILFLELACIRWFPAHVFYLTFFTNVVLLACFLGMSVGCLAAARKTNFLAWSPYIIFMTLTLALGFESMAQLLLKNINVGDQRIAPELVFFGTEYFFSRDVAQIAVPIELLCGVFFILIALVMVGPGQELGRAFNRMANRVQAYTINVLGSILGIVLFAALSWLELNPFWWFLLVVLGVAYFLYARPQIENKKRSRLAAIILIAVPLLSMVTPDFSANKSTVPVKYTWSPYYLVKYDPAMKSVEVNKIGHQKMFGLAETISAGYKYAFPYMLNRDAGGAPFKEVLIIGAGTGNDVSRALQWGAQHVDAVEIDPTILRIGQQAHPDKPYSDPRVTVHLDDGRNFLKKAQRQYDLIIYALVDSLVLHSSQSNIRLESFLFTQEAFTDVRRLLKNDGLFVMYNYFRQGWIVARLQKTLVEVFQRQPLVMAFPYHEIIAPNTHDHFTLMMVGNTGHIEQAFKQWPTYYVRPDVPPIPSGPNGFLARQEGGVWAPLRLTKIVQPEALILPTDNWPFLYLRNPMIPHLSIKGILTMGGIALAMIFLFMPRGRASGRRLSFNGRMFFLGAGFMLIETKGVVQMALLFGSTWMVNSLVFLAIMVMILGSNLWVLKFNPRNLLPYYVLLFISLVLNSLVPLNYFLGLDGPARIIGSCLLVFTPILLAGVIFAVSFGRSQGPDVDFGFNIAGAMLGGLAEYSSMLLGFQHLVLVAIVFYFLSVALAKPINLAWPPKA